MEVGELFPLITFENYLESARFSIEFTMFQLGGVKYPLGEQKYHGNISSEKVV